MIDKLISWIRKDSKCAGVKMAELKLGDKVIANIDELREYYSYINILEYCKSSKLVAWYEKNGYSDEAKAVESLVNKLREYYSFSDIFEVFKSGALVAWCEKNGYRDEAKAVESLAQDSPKSPHLQLYEIFNGADKTPQWLRDYFVAYSKWEQKQDELSALIDKALPLYEVLEKNNYAESEADKKERESLNDKINEIECVARDIYFECENLLSNIPPNDGNNLNEMARLSFGLRLSFALMSLYMQTMQSNQIKRAKITEIQVSMLQKDIEKMSEEERNTPLSEILKKDNS